MCASLATFGKSGQCSNRIGHRHRHLTLRLASFVEHYAGLVELVLHPRARESEPGSERLGRTPYKIPEQRWGTIFPAAAPAILGIVLQLPWVSMVIARRLESILLHEAPNPNLSRRRVIERVGSGVAWA